MSLLILYSPDDTEDPEPDTDDPEPDMDDPEPDVDDPDREDIDTPEDREDVDDIDDSEGGLFFFILIFLGIFFFNPGPVLLIPLRPDEPSGRILDLFVILEYISLSMALGDSLTGFFFFVLILTVGTPTKSTGGLGNPPCVFSLSTIDFMDFMAPTMSISHSRFL